MQTLKFNRDKSTGPNFTNFIFLETLGNYLHNATGFKPIPVVELKWQNKQGRDFSALEKLLKINQK
jgi:hypothetical protein